MMHVAVCDKKHIVNKEILISRLDIEQNNTVLHSFPDWAALSNAINTGQNYDLYLLDKSVLEECTANLRGDRERFFLVSTRSGCISVPFSSIICIECYHRTMTFYVEDSNPLYSKQLRKGFGAAVAPLLEDKRFLYVRKSCVINMSKVKSITKKSFVMKNRTEVIIPRYNYTEVKNQYINYISWQ